MELKDVILQRRAIRKYTDQPVTDEVLDNIVALALEAPTAFNAQRADIVVIRNQEAKDGIYATSNQTQHRDAPVVLAIVANTYAPTDLESTVGSSAEYVAHVNNFFSSLDSTALRDGAIKDAMLVGGFALLAAQNEGLATSPTTGFDPEGVAQVLNLPEGREVVFIISLGYPAESVEHPGRASNRRINERY